MTIAQSFAEGNLGALFPNAVFTHTHPISGARFYLIPDADDVDRLFSIKPNGEARFFAD